MWTRDLEVRAGEVRVSKFGLVERTSQDEEKPKLIEGSSIQECPGNA
jgi:hypothetical protein